MDIEYAKFCSLCLLSSVPFLYNLRHLKTNVNIVVKVLFVVSMSGVNKFTFVVRKTEFTTFDEDELNKPRPN